MSSSGVTFGTERYGPSSPDTPFGSPQRGRQLDVKPHTIRIPPAVHEFESPTYQNVPQPWVSPSQLTIRISGSSPYSGNDVDDYASDGESSGIQMSHHMNSSHGNDTGDRSSDDTDEGEYPDYPDVVIPDDGDDDEEYDGSQAAKRKVVDGVHDVLRRARSAANAKKKQKRHRLSHAETRFLLSEFASDPRPTAERREELAKCVAGMNARKIQVWFQNRRAKLKRISPEDANRISQSRAIPMLNMNRSPNLSVPSSSNEPHGRRRSPQIPEDVFRPTREVPQPEFVLPLGPASQSQQSQRDPQRWSRPYPHRPPVSSMSSPSLMQNHHSSAPSSYSSGQDTPMSQTSAFYDGPGYHGGESSSPVRRAPCGYSPHTSYSPDIPRSWSERSWSEPSPYMQSNHSFEGPSTPIGYHQHSPYMQQQHSTGPPSATWTASGHAPLAPLHTSTLKQEHQEVRYPQHPPSQSVYQEAPTSSSGLGISFERNHTLPHPLPPVQETPHYVNPGRYGPCDSNTEPMRSLPVLGHKRHRSNSFSEGVYH
ncbi:homeobox-domain-containing protein [Saitoella complicata NRRL Y-17804]|uniref:Homeobox domain-containing protein n=1 Tax=Saitoella complicata (strain BCRC 22490 / CBS 7301 / JCM 7358 / NBRC 10748 / NRRL Y-17804) TaxID=698492 RepID=A0A0E9NSG8_SAICN|nr:homeobox-domain-containing protein [Saitoella complicata NRRL Y-17804]ODQ52542.1 homeobox-domain-containing protein [Saitoella complicata NRRL Y-17804]GAO52718.1 hypothetical protein G7K_6789-t1 [Saitoella complicata NRRL Y-17804]